MEASKVSKKPRGSGTNNNPNIKEPNNKYRVHEATR